jgi:Protein of unknown function (DUF4019)
MNRTFARLVALAVVTAGCSVAADTAAAEAGVPAFHALVDAGKFEQIYEQSSDDLKKVSTPQDFTALLEAVHRKLGNTRSSEKQGWTINYHTSGTFVTLTYKTMYTEGEAAEQFVFRMQGKSATLAGYHINSNALILK